MSYFSSYHKCASILQLMGKKAPMKNILMGCQIYSYWNYLNITYKNWYTTLDDSIKHKLHIDNNPCSPRISINSTNYKHTKKKKLKT